MRYTFYILLIFPFVIFGQKLISGKVMNSGEIESIHVFNKTYNKYTITDQKGMFKIPIRINDTLVFSAIQFKLKEVVISNVIINSMQLSVLLKEQVNELDAVYIKPNLSGDLLADSRNIKTKDVLTAKTLNLPNANVIPPTQAERKLYTATHSDGGIDAIINAISGRTKRLKKIIRLENKTNKENLVYANFKEIMRDDFNIPEDKLYHFIYYVSDDKLFNQIVKSNSNIIIYDFIKAKSKTYLAQKNKNKPKN
jgi:DNA repair exonuclease SbcCD nuclease subunit